MNDPGNTTRNAGRRRPPHGDGVRIGDRDVALLSALFKYGVLARNHLQLMFFTSVCRCNARLLQLLRAGYIDRLQGEHSGTGQAVYRIAAAAYPAIAEHLGLGVSEVKRLSRARRGRNVQHTLGLASIALAVRSAVEGTEKVSIDLLLTEWECRHEYRVVTNRGRVTRVFKPDGFVRFFVHGTIDLSLFIEFDRCNASVPKFLQTIQNHSSYRESGLFEQRFGTDLLSVYTVVITTGGTRRSESLRRAAERLGATFMLFAPLESVVAEGFLGASWRWPGLSEPVRILDLAAETGQCGSA